MLHEDTAHICDVRDVHVALEVSLPQVLQMLAGAYLEHRVLVQVCSKHIVEQANECLCPILLLLSPLVGEVCDQQIAEI